MSESRIVELSYRLTGVPDDWVLRDDEPLAPESRPHDLANDRLKALLSFWIARTGRDAIIARGLAIRWLEERPSIGIDPDIALIEPTPPDADDLLSLKLWKPGHPIPPLAIEVVSPSHPYKDYAHVQERYAAFGVGELVVLDARLQGPKKLGGPFAIQIWRFAGGSFSRVYQGAGPAHSTILNAWFSFENRIVQISDDEAGTERWLTETETLQRKSAELEARVRELEASQGTKR